MDEYIERDFALDVTKRTCGDYATAFCEIAHHRAADVVPVVHGKWGTDRFGMERSVCSICRATYVGGDFWNYCPKCGAKMDLK